VIPPALGELVMHEPVEIIPVHLHVLPLPFLLVGLNLLRTPVMLLVVIVLLREVVLLGRLKHLPLLDLFS
jgi:hypothetical protein